MNKYAVIYEAPTPEVGNWSSYVPDLPGCVSVGDTLEECRANMAEAVAAHVTFMRQRGLTVPDASTRTEELAVAA